MKKYILICGDSFKGLNFEQREQVRNRLRTRLLNKGIRLIEYVWIYDNTERAQLLFYECEHLKEARYWIRFLIKNGFNIRITDKIP